MNPDRLTRAHQKRSQIHAYILAHPGTDAEDIMHNNARINGETARRCIRYLMDSGNIRRAGMRAAARYYALTESIQPVEEIRKNMCVKHVRQREEKLAAPAGPLPPGVTRNIAGSLPRPNHGGQGAVIGSVWRGCSMS